MWILRGPVFNLQLIRCYEHIQVQCLIHRWPDSILFPMLLFKTNLPFIQHLHRKYNWGLKWYMVHTLSVQVTSTSVSSPPAPVANSVFLGTHSQPPWRWQWVWMKWCGPTVLWSVPRSPPLWSAAWTSRWLKTFLQPKQTQFIVLLFEKMNQYHNLAYEWAMHWVI